MENKRSVSISEFVGKVPRVTYISRRQDRNHETRAYLFARASRLKFAIRVRETVHTSADIPRARSPGELRFVSITGGNLVSVYFPFVRLRVVRRNFRRTYRFQCSFLFLFFLLMSCEQLTTIK